MLLSKKIFILSSVVFLIVIFFWGIYNFSFKKPAIQKNVLFSEERNPDDSSAKEHSIQTSSNERIQVITDEPTLAPVLSANNDSLKYYAKATGKVYELDLFTLNKKVISDINLIGLIDVFWSPNQSKVITKFSGGSGYPKFHAYDYISRKGTELNKNIGAISWQNNSKIFYTYFDTKNKKKSINLADADGNNWTKITDFSADNINIEPIPKSGFISFWNKPDSFSQTLFQSISVLGGEIKTLSSETFGADYLWNQDGTFFLRSNVDQKGGHKLELGYANSLGGEYKNLDIPTFVSKCAWSKTNDVVFYALPGAISEKSALPNDYQNNLFTTNDTFWKVHLKTGEKSRLVPLEELTTAYDATDLFLDSSESHLFFTNKIDGRLYRINL